ncbi:MAG: metallophosphoesterase [Ktedonobacteraceae bacterium]|nr:metallophosphoesterase [Ktedonobacteraceae bacterium]
MTEKTREHASNEEAAQQERREDVVTVVLTADNHLGYAAFGQHLRKREERQQQLRHAFQQATDFAIEHSVDLFIQAGDLFDTTTPDERDRSFVAERLAQLKQANIHTFALGGVHDTPSDAQSPSGDGIPAPQISYARLGALHYFSPPPRQDDTRELEAANLELHGLTVSICGLSVLPGQEGNPLKRLRVHMDDSKPSDISLLVLHAPIESLSTGSSLLDTRAQVRQSSIARQSTFQYILAGYHHSYHRLRFGQSDVVVAGATQHIDFSTPDSTPGFVFLGLAPDGIRWCDHIKADSPPLRSLVIQTHELWPEDTSEGQESHPSPTEIILERLRPLCDASTMVQLRLIGELTRQQYHQLDLNQIRYYGEEHCFALAIDDSSLALLHDQEINSPETGERFSPREELISLVDEWIAVAADEQEKKSLVLTREELLLAMDDTKDKH